jgi:hypothetical protein
MFSPASNDDGNAEELWATQDQTRFDARNVPQHSALPEFEFNGEYGLHGSNAVQSTDADEAAYHFTGKRLTPLKTADTISGPGLVGSPSFPIPFGGVPASEDSTGNLQNYSDTPGDSQHSGVNEFSFLERSLGSPSESAEKWISELFSPALAEPNSQQNHSEPCRHHLGAGASGMHAPEYELSSLPVFEHIPRSAGCSQVNMFDMPSLEIQHSYISQSTYGWKPVDVDVGSIFLPEASRSHPLLYNSAEPVPNTLLSELPIGHHEFPTANATVEGATPWRDGRKKHQESPKRSRTHLLKPKFDDFLLEFDLKSESGPRKRTRKAFSYDERKKVNAVRKTHACVSCQARKTSVHLRIPVAH